MLVDLAFRQARTAAAQRVQELAHALLADIHAVESDLDRAVFGEEVDDLVPQGFVEVVAVSALQALDVGGVLDQRLAVL